MLDLCSFSCAFSIGGEGFFRVKYFILCLSVNVLHSYSVLCISFWQFLVGSLGRVGKRLTARNGSTFSMYVLVSVSTVVVPLSYRLGQVLHFWLQACFNCFMIQSCLLCKIL
jgi:hypothetical protein